MQDRRLRADVLFIRARSVIRADGTPSAQGLSPQIGFILCPRDIVAGRTLRAPRANRVSARMKSASAQKHGY